VRCIYAEQEVFEFVEELVSVIPESKFYPRKGYDVKEVVEFAKNADYTDLLLVNEYRKKPSTLARAASDAGAPGHAHLAALFRVRLGVCGRAQSA